MKRDGKKSIVISVKKISASVKRVTSVFYNDTIALYAAQASFFIIISVIPFIMLLLSLARYIAPVSGENILSAIGAIAPDASGTLFDTIAAELSEKRPLSLVSLSAFAALWSASRGVASVSRGICGVYRTNVRRRWLAEVLRSIIHTLLFLAMILLSLVILVFGVTIRNSSAEALPALSAVFNVIINCQSLVFFVILTLLFSLIYSSLSQSRRTNDPGVPRGFRAQLPGAALAAVSWLLFSYIYSLYIQYFPRASYIYGSLAAIVLLMLWLYCCMIILLCGAQINKSLVGGK